MHSYRKKNFQLHKLRSSLIRSKNTSIFWLLLYPVCYRSKVTIWQQGITNFFLFFATEALGMCLPYVNRYFQSHHWCYFLQVTKYLDYFIVDNAGLREIKGHSLRKEHFLKCSCTKILSMYLPYTNKYFQMHQWSYSFLRPQNTRIFSFLLEPV